MNMMRHIISALMVLICLSMILSLSICPGANAENGSTPARPAPWDHIVSVACGDNFTIGLRSDGRVAYAGDKLSPEIQKIAEWEHIERIEVQNGCYAVGYKEDGGIRLATIHKPLTGAVALDDTDVADWSEVRQVFILPECGLGLRKDGSLLYTDRYALTWRWGFDEEWEPVEDLQWGAIPDQAPVFCGIREDGTLTGFWGGYKYLFPEIDFHDPEEAEWHDITNLYGTYAATYALRSDGRICCYTSLSMINLRYEWDNYAPLADVSAWRDVVQFRCDLSDYSPVALRRDGTVVTLRINSIAEEIAGWTGVKEIIGYGDRRLLGLRKDGTVLGAGFDEETAREIASWTDVKTIIQAGDCFLALRNDGTMLAISATESPSNNVETLIRDVRSWTEVTEIATDDADFYQTRHAVGLRRDGTVVGAGENSDGQLNFNADCLPNTEDENPGEDHSAAADAGQEEAEEELTEGVCGENLRWKLDEGGHLRIFGTGAMDNYGKPEWRPSQRIRETMTAEHAPWYPVREKISTVSIEGAETVGYQAFLGCSNLREITFSDGLRRIEEKAFLQCGGLSVIRFPDGLEKIGSEAFQHCTGLKELWFPDSLKTIEDAAFQGCEELVKVTLTGDTELESDMGFIGCCRVFEGCRSLKSAGPIGSGCDFEFAWTDHIGGFTNWWNLEKVVIPETVTAIDDCAFFGCRSLRSIQIPDSVRSIGYSAFSKCINLVHVELPKNLAAVSWHMFYDCKNLKEITIPENTFLERGAFKGCTSLKKINMPEHVNEECTGYMEELFLGCSALEEITLPEGIRGIDPLAFKGCTNLKRIVLPESLEYIDAAAFMDCPNLQYVYYHGNDDWEKIYSFPVLTDYMPERCGYFDAAEKLPLPTD